MPIKNLTEREAAFPRIGILRKGAEKPRRGIGKDLTYFRFTSEYSEVVEAFYANYGKQPRDINCFLPYQTTDENFSTWREHWVAGGLVHRCDGETCTVSRQKDGTYSTEPQPCPGQCKPIGRLSVMIPELKRLAFITVLTTSLHDIMTLSENLTALEMLRGDLRGIPLVLHRRPRMVSMPGTNETKGKRVRREKWLLTIEAAPQWVSMQLAAQQANAIPRLPDGSLPELAAPEDQNNVTIDGATGEIVDTGNGGPDWDSVSDTAPPEEPPEMSLPPDQAASRPTNGNGRPLTAERLRDVIRQKSGWQDTWREGEHGGRINIRYGARPDGEPITDGQKGGLIGLLTDAFGTMPKDSQDHARHDILRYLISVDSANKPTKREASALISWLKVPDEGEWTINQYAAAEVARVLEAVAIDQGQQPLPMEAG